MARPPDREQDSTAHEATTPSVGDVPANLFERVARAAAAVANELRTARLVEVILEHARLFGATTAMLFATDTQRRELVLLGQSKLLPGMARGLERIPFDAPFVSARAATTRDLQLVTGPERLDSSMILTQEMLRSSGSATVLSVPLVASGTLVGTPIPPDELPKLFDRFMRTEEAAKGPIRGVGLGLYIANGLVEAHGGRMWVESDPQRTTFSFALPVRRAEVQRPAA
jgi:hypothetical protein